MIAAERWVIVWTGWIEDHPARLIGASTATIGAVLGVIEPSITTIANVGVLGFTLSMVTLIVRALLTALRAERHANREMREALQHNADRLADDNADLRARIADLERRLHGDGR